MNQINLPIQQTELWDVARQLIGFDTVSASSNVAAARYLGEYLEASGFNVRLLTESVQGIEKATVLAWAGPEVPGGLIVSGHSDVVPFAGQDGWRTDPLVLETDGERLFGRGVSDMKVFIAQALIAGRQLALETLRRPLMFIFTCDEELASQGAGRLIKAIPGLFNDYPLPTVALIGEPTNFEIYPAHKGYAYFTIHVKGRGGHSSVPGKGVNAIEKMAEVIARIQAFNADFKTQATLEDTRLFPDAPYSAFNCGVISGGLAANMIAEDCRLSVSVRVTPGANADEILKALQIDLESTLAKGLRATFPGSAILIEDPIVAPPLQAPATGAFGELLSQIMRKPIERGAPFATDGGHLQKLGIDSYICGPGQLEQAHQPNESLLLDHLTLGLERLTRVIRAWCVEQP